MRVFFDTNILVYLFDSDAAEKKELACARFEEDMQHGMTIDGLQIENPFLR
jgi:predicted nucleic acid-binding protein